jgi:putative membrane protein
MVRKFHFKIRVFGSPSRYASRLLIRWPRRLVSAVEISVDDPSRVFLFLQAPSYNEFAGLFFLNRLQQTVMHDFGPFLIAFAWPGAVIYLGMPRPLRRLIEAPLLARILRASKQPMLASFLFVGVVALWLVPTIHLRAMLDPKLYQVMNWSMVIDGILFWMLVLDPRPKPPAFLSFGTRAAMAAAVMLPQTMIGALITFAPHDLYTFYDWCGRVYSLSALEDQQLGGLIIWIPPTMMNTMALILVLYALLSQQDRKVPKDITRGQTGWI